MVLFKRKPVRYLPHPQIDDHESHVWVVPESNEVFTSYDAYLERMDFFKSKRFTCEVSGRSGLTFFDALRSEQAGSREIDEAFPQALREPVLRRVQFSTVSRIDNLVEDVFNDFRDDFYPGELVTVILDDGERLNGHVRDKAKFAEVRNQDGSVQREAFSRYFVKLLDRDDEEALVDDRHIVRDRKVFTKQMLRSFIKNTVTREGWNGAPWLVKPEIADRFRIDTNVPPHLRQGHKAAVKKAEKRQSMEQEGMFGVWQSNPEFPQLKPVSQGRKNQQVHPHYQQFEVQIPPHYHENYPPQAMQDQGLMPRSWGHMHPPPAPYQYEGYYNGYPQYMPPNGHYYPQEMMPPQHTPAGAMIQPPPPPPPIKYPIDDLDVEPVRDGTHRPILKFVTKEQCHDAKDSDHVIAGLRQENVGLLLETWNTLNVYCQVLKLDSFTFDDFVEALKFSSLDAECELLVEVHCALLKQLVKAENDENGAIQISLPDLPDLDEEEEEEAGPESKLPTPTPEPEYPAKRTRSSLNKVQFAEPEPEPEPEEDVSMVEHRAAEMFTDYGWIERLRKRDLLDGGWELVMVGLLHQLSGRPRLTASCNKILSHLAPLDAEPASHVPRLQYITMDINLRAEALQIISQLFLETKTVKNFLEEMSNTMTHYRKIKIEHQRARKDAIAKLKDLHNERRLLAPEPEKSPTPMPELEEAMENTNVDEDTSIADSEDEDPVVTRSLRRGADRAAERKRKRDEEEARREKAKEEKQTKGSKEYQKVLKQIEKERENIDKAEEAIIVVDGDLREADCPRTRVLGKDRFCNRYWWLERNAMPHEGLPDSSTADAEYANGRIWVQGPDQMELDGFIDINEPDKQAYYRRFQMTPAERKKLEEGSTNLKSATEWGFYDSAEELDMLIGWLDSRGLRELKLKKELNMQRDVIIKHMEKRAAYLEPREDSEEPPTRIATRAKNHVSEKTHRCLRWKNSTALAELGHRHVEAPPKPRQRGKKGVVTYDEEKLTTRASAANASAAASASVLNRQGKPVTRQGTRYNF
jgi:hypothetical protein